MVERLEGFGGSGFTVCEFRLWGSSARFRNRRWGEECTDTAPLAAICRLQNRVLTSQNPRDPSIQIIPTLGPKVCS